MKRRSFIALLGALFLVKPKVFAYRRNPGPSRPESATKMLTEWWFNEVKSTGSTPKHVYVGADLWDMYMSEVQTMTRWSNQWSEQAEGEPKQRPTALFKTMRMQRTDAPGYFIFRVS